MRPSVVLAAPATSVRKERTSRRSVDFEIKERKRFVRAAVGDEGIHSIIIGNPDVTRRGVCRRGGHGGVAKEDGKG